VVVNVFDTINTVGRADGQTDSTPGDEQSVGHGAADNAVSNE